jgi:hypothetical protein
MSLRVGVAATPALTDPYIHIPPFHVEQRRNNPDQPAQVARVVNLGDHTQRGEAATEFSPRSHQDTKTRNAAGAATKAETTKRTDFKPRRARRMARPRRKRNGSGYRIIMILRDLRGLRASCCPQITRKTQMNTD